MASLKKDSSAYSKTSKSENNRKVGTNNLLFCLRPAVLEPDHQYRYGPSRGEPAVLTYIAAMPKKERPVSYPKVLPTNDMSLEEEGSGVGGGFPGKKISGSHRFSRVLKAVMFEPSTARKSKKGKSDKKSPKPLGIESARYNYQDRSNIENDFDFGQRIISRSVSALADSSSAATAASNNITLCPTCSSSLTAAKTTSFGPSSSVSKKASNIATPTSHEINNAVEQQSQKKFYRSCNRGLFFMLLSLLVLIFWGKICCIFWTSTWLFIAPRWMVKDGRVDSSPAAMKPSEFKKKVVMEGLLARERGRISC